MEAAGVETVHYEDDDGDEKEFNVDYKIFDRRSFRVYEDTSFFDYEGEVEFKEDAISCGANRTECSGVSAYIDMFSVIDIPLENLKHSF